MIAVDTSVAVAGVLADHPRHEVARRVLAQRPSIPVHVLVESYAVLTRLPAPLRQDPATAIALLEANFEARLLELPAGSVGPLLRRLATDGIGGGATYDALVAESARLAGATLRSLDERAVHTYRAVGVEVDPVT